MFDKINDVRKAICDFKSNHGRYPNVIFISRDKRRKFIEEAYFSLMTCIVSPVKDYFGDFRIFGVKVVWTENTDSIDYMEEFDDKYNKKFGPSPSVKTETFICPKCLGTGIIIVNDNGYEEHKPCFFCSGNGYEHLCGYGFVSTNLKDYSIKKVEEKSNKRRKIIL